MVGFVVGLLVATVQSGSSLIYASLGELVAERAGILNLGVEGMMLVGALCGFVTTVVTGNPYLGFLVGAVAGMAFSSIHAFLSITLKSDQVISGVMLTLLGTGLTTFFGKPWVSKSIDGFGRVTIPVAVKLPYLGPALFNNTVPDYLAILLVPAVWYFLGHTNLGLEISAIGDDPETADTMGVHVFRLQYLAVLIGGALAGAAGAQLSLAFSKLWIGGMTAGRGWIAIALVIFAQWRPSRAIVGAYLFGGISALAIRTQGISFAVGHAFPFAGVINPALAFLTNSIILSTYPYVATIIVLAVVSQGELRERIGAPNALLQAYSRELD